MDSPGDGAVPAVPPPAPIAPPSALPVVTPNKNSLEARDVKDFPIFDKEVQLHNFGKLWFLADLPIEKQCF